MLSPRVYRPHKVLQTRNTPRERALELYPKGNSVEQHLRVAVFHRR